MRFGNINNQEVDSTLKQLALVLARQKFFALIIFDNADRYYFNNCRYSFFPDYGKERDCRLDAYLLALIRKFIDEPAFGKIAASVLFVCRNYVFNHCRDIEDAVNRTRAISAKHTAYQLLPTDVKDVVHSRFLLLKNAVSAVRANFSGKGSKYETQVKGNYISD